MERRKSGRGMSKEFFTILICLACQICISSSTSTPPPATGSPTNGVASTDTPTPPPASSGSTPAEAATTAGTTPPAAPTTTPAAPTTTTIPATTIGPGDVTPTGVTVDAIDTSSVNVTWVAAATDGTTYTVTTSAITTGGTEPTTNPSDPTTEPFQLVSGLGPGHNYSFVVTGIKGDVSGPADPVYQNTKPSTVKNPAVAEIKTEKVNVTWEAPDGVADDYTVTSAALDVWNSKHGSLCTDDNASGPTTWRTVCELHPGSNYSFSITAKSGEMDGEPTTKDAFTVPLHPETCVVDADSKTKEKIVIDITLRNTISGVTEYFVNYTDEDRTSRTEKKSKTGETTRHEITGLVAGTNYDLETWSSTTGGNSSAKCSSTGQTALDMVTNIQAPVDSVTDTSIKVTFTNATGRWEKYEVTCAVDDSDWPSPDPRGITKPDPVTIECYNNDDCICKGLLQGQTFLISVKTMRTDFEIVTSNTRQGKTDVAEAAGITVHSEGENNIDVRVAQGKGRFDHYSVVCTDTIGTASAAVQCQPNVECNCTGLIAGEKYTITAETIRAGFRTRPPAKNQTEGVTLPKMPKDVSITVHNETYLDVEWTVPQDTTTVFSHYRVYLDGDNVTTVSKNTNNFRLEGLTANTEYNIVVTTISRHTVLGESRDQESNRDTQTTGWTLPLTPQFAETVKTNISISVTFGPASVDGVIGYRLRFMDKDGSCREGVRFYEAGGSFTPINNDVISDCTLIKNLTYDQINQVTYLKEGLLPFTNYSISIYTQNIGGLSQHTPSVIETDEAAPAKMGAPTVTSALNHLDVQWNPPVPPNGIIRNYTVQWRESVTTDYQTVYTDKQTYMIGDLQSQHLYCVRVAAHTIAEGPFSEETCQNTTVALPSKVTNINVVRGSDYMTVSWRQGVRTGYTHFKVELEPKGTGLPKRESSVIQEKLPHDISHVYSETVSGLSPYWDYTVKVTAYTDVGSAVEEDGYHRTLEGTPAAVLGLEGAQSTERLRATVKWKAPSPINQNGLLVKFIISYTEGDVPDTRHVEHTSGCSDYCDTREFIEHIEVKAERNYTIKVKAQTQGGINGEEDTILIVIRTWAPHTNDTLGEPTSTLTLGQTETTKVAVNLQCEFFMNEANGRIHERGLVINGKDKVPQGQGLKSVTTEAWKTEHKKYNVGSKDTPPQWRWEFKEAPACSGQTGRRRLLQTPVTFSRVVGEGCDDTDTFCNGKLTENTDYTFQSYACTASHCQVTTARAVKTAAVPSGSSPPVAAIVAPIVVVICLALVIVAGVMFMRRRNYGTQDDESEMTGIAGGEVNPSFVPENPKAKKVVEPVGPIEKHRFTEHVKKYHKDTDLLFSEEYKLIKERCGKYPWTAADLPVNRNKNRYTNILPYDHSRVKLLPTDDDEGSDYINANYMPGYNSRREFIAAQGPLPGTVDDFWRMVWEQNVTMIIMLTQCMEKGKPKCEQYWPKDEEPHFIGDLQVQIRSESVLNTYTIRVLDVKLGGQNRQIKQFHFTVWPDFGCPKTTGSVIEFVSHVRTHMKPDSKGPCIVHCSAGVGRTGTFIAVDRLIQHIRDYTTIDIYHLVMEMREHRCNMVQTEDQYIYIHDCMKDAIEQAGNEARNGSTQNEANGSVAEKSV